MPRLLNALREHRHFFIVVALLTLVMTFPAGLHVFDYKDLWFPSTNLDVFMKIWDGWHGWNNISSPSDFFFTNLLFYPHGVSLTFHNYSLPHMIVQGGLAKLMPVSNAYTLTYLLFVFTVACSSYVYLFYLMEDRSIATLGAIIVAMSPFIINQEEQVEIQMMATIPLSLYFFHRGAVERRYGLLLLSALLVGATCLIGMYLFVILSLMFAMYCLYFAAVRGRDKAYWIALALCAAIIGAVSLPRIYPMLDSEQGLDEALSKMEGNEIASDLAEYVLNTRNPFTGPFLRKTLGLENVTAIKHNFAFVGFSILILVSVGLLRKPYRRKMLPWMFLLAPFVLLRLGSTLTIGGQQYHDVLLPKHYLDELAPILTKGFYITGIFHGGALLPLAVMAGYGALSIVRSLDGRRRAAVIGVCVVLISFEYYSEIQPRVVSKQNLAHLRWLGDEPGAIRLINLPMGRQQSKWYGFLQTRSGYPQAEGLVARTPSSAYSDIRAKYLLEAWYFDTPVKCADTAYLAGLDQLEEDGFSHVVFHEGLPNAYAIRGSFPGVAPSYMDEFVAIYRLNDLRLSCPLEVRDRLPLVTAYRDILQQNSILDERHGYAVLIAASQSASADIIKYLRHLTQIKRDVVTIAGDETANIDVQSLQRPDLDGIAELEARDALWLLRVPQARNAEQTAAFQDWFAERFRFCQRGQEDESAVFDLYLRVGIPCSAMDQSSEVDAHYDSGALLHNASYVVDGNLLRFFLAWTNFNSNNYAFSLQFFDQNGDKPLQYDNVIYRQLLSTHEIDISSLPDGEYSIQLIVYDFETQVSQGGTVTGASERFERELEIARIEWKP